MTLGAIPEAKVPREDELERDEKFSSGRVIVVAIDHGPSSQVAFTWALDQFVIHADTIHLIHVLPKASGAAQTPIVDATQLLFDKLTKEAYHRCNVKVLTILRSGETGKEVCAEAERSKAVAVIMGSRGLSAVKSMLVGSVTDYCIRHSPAPLIIVPAHYRHPELIPGKEVAEGEHKVDAR